MALTLKACYEILAIPETATLETVNEAYANLIQLYHPHLIRKRKNHHPSHEEIEHYIKLLSAYSIVTARLEVALEDQQNEVKLNFEEEIDSIKLADFSVQDYLNAHYVNSQNLCLGTWIALSNPECLYFYPDPNTSGHQKRLKKFLQKMGYLSGAINLVELVDHETGSYCYELRGLDQNLLKRKAEAYQASKTAHLSLSSNPILTKDKMPKSAASVDSIQSSEEDNKGEEVKILKKSDQASSNAENYSMLMIYERNDLSLKVCPTPSTTSSDPSRQITIGDLHGNALKLIYILIKHGILKLENNESDYQVLVELYEKYRLTREEAEDGEHPSACINQQTNFDLLLFNTIIENAHINPEFIENPNFIIRLLGDEFADRGANDYFTLKIIEKLHKSGINLEILLSNHGLEFLEASEGYELCLMTDETIAKPGKLYLQVKNETLLYTVITPKGELVRDVAFETKTIPLSDPLDLASLAPYKNTILACTTKAEHTRPTFVDYQSRIGKKQSLSLIALQNLIEFKHLSEEEVLKLAQECYKPKLKLLSYTISENKKEITLYTHAPVGLETIEALARKLNIEYKDATTLELGATIDQINDIFQKIYVQQDLVHSLFKEYTGAPCTLEENPFNLLIWLRNELKWQSLVERNRPPIHKGYNIYYVHGHDGAGISNEPNIVNMDNMFGKYEFDLGALYLILQCRGLSRICPLAQGKTDQNAVDELKVAEPLTTRPRSASQVTALTSLSDSQTSLSSTNALPSQSEEKKDISPDLVYEQKLRPPQTATEPRPVLQQQYSLANSPSSHFAVTPSLSSGDGPSAQEAKQQLRQNSGRVTKQVAPKTK